MSYTLGDALTAARDRSPYFDKARIPRGPLVRFATDIQRSLLQKAAMRAPDRFTTTQVVTITQPAQVGTPITVNPNLLVVRVETDFTGANPLPEKTRMVPASRLYDMEHDRGVYFLDGAMYLTGQAADWGNVASLTVYLVPLPDPFAAEADAWTLPDDAHEAFVSRLAAQMATHINGTPFDDQRPTSPPIAIDVDRLEAKADRAEHDWFVALVTGVRQARVANRNTMGTL